MSVSEDKPAPMLERAALLALSERARTSLAEACDRHESGSALLWEDDLTTNVDCRVSV
jgi:hypothetical protein